MTFRSARPVGVNAGDTLVVPSDMISGLLLDVRDAVRALRQAPWFTGIAIATLGAGLALCIVLLTLANAWLLAPLPYPEAGRLYTVQYGAPGSDHPEGMEGLPWTALAGVVEETVAWDLDVFTIRGAPGPESAPGAWVTPGFIAALGVTPALGPGFSAADFQPGRPSAALISHDLWVRRFHSDPQIVGRQFEAYVSDRPEEAETFTIAGVLPRDLWHVNTYTDVMAPLRATAYPYQVRLRRGVSPTLAAERITALVRTGGASVPAGWRVALISTQQSYTARIRPMFRAVGVASALVLLMACANVAVLQLLRSHKRQRELAIRLALGSSRVRVARLVIAEALIVGGAATLLALASSAGTTTRLAPLVERQLGRTIPGGVDAVGLDGRVIAGVIVFAVVTVTLCALAPLVASRRAEAAAVLGASGRTSTDAAGPRRARQVLIAFEVATSIALLSGSILMAQSVRRMLQVDVGFRAESVQTAGIGLRLRTYPDQASRARFYDRLLRLLDDMPGVASAALVDWWPLQARRPQRVERPRPGGGQASDAGETTRGAMAGTVGVTPGYFDTLQIPLLEGRGFTTSDRLGAEQVAILSRSLATRLFPGASAVGQRVRLAAESGPPDGADSRQPADLVVVGVVGDVRQGVADTDVADLYRPLLQQPGRFTFVHARVRDAGPWGAAMARAVTTIDPDLPLGAVRPLQGALERERARPGFLASLLGVFALPAALLALLGLHAAMAYSVRQREREIAIRMALGAERGAVTRAFVAQGAWTLAAGVAMGVPAAVLMGRLLQSELFGVQAAEPWLLAITSLGLVGCGLLAIWRPARRAARTDPALALKND